MDITETLNGLKQAIHQLANDKGWYDETETEAQFVNRTCANLHDEVSELHTAFREGKLFKPCDKVELLRELRLAELTCVEEELADIIIRALDTAGRLRVDIGRAVMTKHALNVVRPYRHGGKLS